MGGRKKLKAPALRRSASAALFPILRDLEIQAALTHKAALALHKKKGAACKAQEIKVVVKLEDRFTLGGLCTAVVSHARARARASARARTSANANTNGYLRRSEGDLGPQLEFFPTRPYPRSKFCQIIFIPSGGSFPTILEDFSEIVYISDIPVLPVHSILLEQFITRSRLPAPNRLGKGAAKFMRQCLLACGTRPLQQLSPLWRSPDVLRQITQHVEVVPGIEKRWIACGIDPSISTSTTPWPLPNTPDEAGKDDDSDDDDSDDDDSDDGDSDLGASEDPSAIAQALHVAPEEPDHGNWHSAEVTDTAARHVVDILKGFGIECAVVGSAASQLYSRGKTRIPEQLDILVLQGDVSLTPSLLKQSLLQWDPARFEWKNENLHFLDYSSLSLPRQECKVEILLPSTTDLPNLAPSDVIWIDNLPVVPFLTLLLFKLQAWEKGYGPAKARDVVNLLLLAPNLPVTVFRLWTETKRMSDKFQMDSEARVKRFCSHIPEAKSTWAILGFNVEW